VTGVFVLGQRFQRRAEPDLSAETRVAPRAARLDVVLRGVHVRGRDVGLQRALSPSPPWHGAVAQIRVRQGVP